MMKKHSVKSHQLNTDSLEHAKAKRKYQNLLEDDLRLQKECMSKRKKLRAMKKKKEILTDDIRFLRQRCKYLTKLKSVQVENERDLQENADIQEEPKKYRTYVEEEQEADGGEEVVTKTSNTSQKKLKSCLRINRSKSVKNKVTWQDQVTLL